MELANMAANKNTVPGDKSALTPGGIRIGWCVARLCVFFCAFALDMDLCGLCIDRPSTFAIQTAPR